MSTLEAIAQTVRTLAQPGMKAKELVEAVRKRHPKASKKDVSRAAFYAVIQEAEADPERAAALQDIAIKARVFEEDLPSAAASERQDKRPKDKKRVDSSTKL